MEVFTQEVDPRLGALERLMRSLYSNGSGGPPGYLEMARAEDKERFAKLFEMADAARSTAVTLQTFIEKHETAEDDRKDREDQIRDALAAANAKQNTRLTLIVVAMAIVTALLTAVLVWEGLRQVHSGEITLPHFFGSIHANQVYAETRPEISHY